MKQNPNRVTMFGASHSGSNSTNAFHYIYLRMSAKFDWLFSTYVVLEDIIRNQGFVDTGIFVRLEVDERLFRDALMCGFL